MADGIARRRLDCPVNQTDADLTVLPMKIWAVLNAPVCGKANTDLLVARQSGHADGVPTKLLRECCGFQRPPPLAHSLALLWAFYPLVGGMFDLDPCSPVRRGSEAPVRARTRLTAEDDALPRPWRARSVFMNPPNGHQLAVWVAKALEEYLSGRAGLIIALVPARTDTR